MSRKPPNVLLVVSDQLRYDAIHTPLAQTPRFDRLRAQGFTSHQHYTPLGICSPARASLFTGLYPHSNGVLNNMNNPDQLAKRLSVDVPTLAEMLSDAGYRTGYVGKWHLGHDAQPETRGFDDSRMPDLQLRFGPEFDDYWAKIELDHPDSVLTRYPEPGPRFLKRFERLDFPMYATGSVDENVTPGLAVQRNAAELLTEYAASDEPFFLTACTFEPHWPNVLPEPYASMYDAASIEPWANYADDFAGKPGANAAGLEHFGVADFTWDDWAPLVAHYLGAVSFVDDLTGRLIDHLDQLGLADDTIVIVTTDHGDMTGSHRQFNKGPLMYEEVYRIPFVVRWPGVARPGSESAQLTSHLDVLPTILAAAGVSPPAGLHGRDLGPLLRGDDVEWREALMCEFHGDEFGLCSQRMIRRDNYKLVFNSNDVRELYDLDADPAEMTNLAYDPAYLDLRKDLEANLLELMHDSEDSLRAFVVNCLG